MNYSGMPHGGGGGRGRGRSFISAESSEDLGGGSFQLDSVPKDILEAFTEAGRHGNVGENDDASLLTSHSDELQGTDSPNGNVHVAVTSDLKPDGSFGEQFILADTSRLWIVNPNGNRFNHQEYPVGGISRVEVEMLVNKSALVAVIDGRRIELCHFTQSRQRDFQHAAHVLKSLAQEGKPPETSRFLDDRPKYCEKCGKLLPEPGGSCPACMNRGQVLIRLFSYLKAHKLRVAGLISLLFIAAGIETLPPYLTKILIDDVLTAPHVEGTATVITTIAGFDVTSAGWSALAWLAMIVTFFLCSRLLLLSLNIFAGRQTTWLGPQIIGELRADIYHHMQRLSLKYFDKSTVGALLNRVMTDTMRVQNFLVGGVPHVALDILMVFMIGFILFSMNWKLTLAVLVPLPLVMYFSKWFWRYIRSLFGRAWGRRALLQSQLHDSLSGVRVVKAFGQEDYEISKFDQYNWDVQHSEARAERTWATFFPLINFFSMSGTFIVWYLGGASVLTPDGMSLGTLMAFFSYLGMFWRPLQMFTRLNQWVTRDLTAAERLFEVLDTEPEIKDDKEAKALPDLEGSVKFEDVVFGYDPLRPVIKKLSVEINAGEMVGLVGRSGVGKSTIINLLCRFYDPQEGSIHIDGTNLKDIKQTDWHRHLGIVPQESFLFNGTIAENIAYAYPDAKLDDIIRASRAANAHNFIMRFPDGYDTRVGNRGSRLSGGERQRIAIARAILHDPKILILDEATSSVDTETEQQIQEALARLVQGRTVFAIAHRLSTLKNASRLLVIDDGELVEFGSHDELIEQDGLYASLVNTQRELSAIQAVGG